MNRISLITALSLGLSGVAFGAFAQDAAAPANPANTTASTAANTAPVADAAAEAAGAVADAANTTAQAVGDAVSNAATTAGQVTGYIAPEGYNAVQDWQTITADQLKGAAVYHAADGAKVGDISDIAISSDGISGVILDVGGFLGMGVHTVSLAPSQIALYSKEGDYIAATNLDKDALKALPEYTGPAK